MLCSSVFLKLLIRKHVRRLCPPLEARSPRPASALAPAPAPAASAAAAAAAPASPAAPALPVPTVPTAGEVGNLQIARKYSCFPFADGMLTFTDRLGPHSRRHPPRRLALCAWSPHPATRPQP